MLAWWRKLAGLLRRDAIDSELEEEMRTHLEMKASAMGDPDAARRQFGSMALLLEDSRAAWGWPRMESWLRDFRYSLRMLNRKRGFAATVVITLGLGIGASSTIYSLIDTILIRPLAYPDSDRLVALREAKSADPLSQTPVAPGRLEDWQRLSGTFEAIAGSYQDTVAETGGQAPERLTATYVSPRFFSVLGMAPAIGRVFTAEEERFGGPKSVVISAGLWRRRFASDPAVIGQRLILSGASYVIVAVMPEEFQYPTPNTELWIPAQARPGLLQIREARFYEAIGRLKQGVGMEQARADLNSVQRRLGERYPKTDAGWSVAMVPLKDRIVGRVQLALGLLFGSVTLLLLIACANVACLLLVRLNGRAAEIATRRSLGAGRAAIARQLLAEGLVYAFLGGLLGMLAVIAGTNLLRTQLPDIPRITELRVDARVLAAVAAISGLAAVLFSLAPIVQTFRRDLKGPLVQAGRGFAGTRQRLPRFLVSAQLSLATALLIGAGLFVRSLTSLQETPLGFQPDRVLTLRISASYAERPEATIPRHRQILDALSSLPGVTAVAMSSGLPGVNPTWPREFEIAGERTPDGTLRFATWRVVTSDYFQALGIPILEGQSCRMDTDPERPFEALVNRSFAEHYFPGRSPIGHTILQGPQGDTAARVVGVVADVREDGPSMNPRPLIYACGYLRYWPDSAILIHGRNPAALAKAAREALANIDPSRPVYSVRPLTDALHGALSQTRFRTLLVLLFSVMALTLAVVGLYGVMAYTVSQRTREIGIRMALGARTGQIAGEVLRSAGMLVGAGAAAGIGLAAAGSRMLTPLLHGVRPSDVTSYCVGIGVLLTVAAIACLIPCQRATSITPTEALRDQ